MSRYPDYLSPNITPTKPGGGFSKSQKSRARREPSGVFALFQPAQIQQFKEAFQLIDHDKDGWVSEGDLKEIFSSLGGIFLRQVALIFKPWRVHYYYAK
jgi:myosin regulatory light chain 12